MKGDGPIPRACSDDAAAYLLSAMEPGEAAEYRRHLIGCAVCREELAASQPVADALAMAAPQYALPSGLRRRVLRAARAEPRVLRPARADARAGKPRRQFRFRAALALAAAAAAVAIAGLTGGSSGARVLQAKVVNSAGTAQSRIAGGQAELIVQHLPPPPAGRIYEVWLKRPGNPPAPTSELFSVTADGGAVVVVPGYLQGVVAILVTQEPAEGSRVSTHRPLIVAPTS